jgi:glyoxylase-like metal-dependent hydrolase (beta-lactamase superfamily II)
LTHGHFDHFCGAKLVKECTGAKVVIHKDDEIMLHETDKNEFEINCMGYDFPEVDADILTEDGTEIVLGNTKITVMHTPGHSMGGVCYLFKEDLVMFSGDTLFKLCAGRADLYGGNGRQELRSLANIGALEGNYKVYPGHEDDTTLDFERENNRYIRTRFRNK